MPLWGIKMEEKELSPTRQARLARLFAELPRCPSSNTIAGFDGEQSLQETAAECGAIITRILECLPDTRMQVNLLQSAIIGILEREGRNSRPDTRVWITGFCDSLNRRWQERQGMKDYLRTKPGPLRDPGWVWHAPRDK